MVELTVGEEKGEAVVGREVVRKRLAVGVGLNGYVTWEAASGAGYGGAV